jgi:hypothetical protein
MSYASASCSVLSTPALPSLDARTVQTIRRGVAMVRFALQSLGFAAVLWLILAGPGVISNQSIAGTRIHSVIPL